MLKGGGICDVMYSIVCPTRIVLKAVIQRVRGEGGDSGMGL
jgi:hypothetical protein